MRSCLDGCRCPCLLYTSRADGICQKDFLDKAYHEAEAALVDVGQSGLAVPNLPLHVGVADDGTGDQLGEQHDVEC